MSISDVSAEDRNWAIYANAAGLLVFTNVPFANLIATFLIWLKVKNDPSMPFARTHARAAFNFQLTWTIAAMAFFVAFLAAVIRQDFGVLAFTGAPLLIVAYLLLIVVNLVASIIGCMRASDVKPFSYPFAIPFIR